MTPASFIPSTVCDAPGCGRWADTAHILPTVRTANRCELACHSHDPGGYFVRRRAELNRRGPMIELLDLGELMDREAAMKEAFDVARDAV